MLMIDHDSRYRRECTLDFLGWSVTNYRDSVFSSWHRYHCTEWKNKTAKSLNVLVHCNFPH